MGRKGYVIMKLVLHNGEIKEVDTSFIFNNQYNTTDGQRIMDTEVKYIIDDIRLGEFYCSSVKQGTYDEVVQAIAEERAKINKCEGCWWFHEHTRIKDECYKNEIKEGSKKIIDERIVYEISCAYIPKYKDKCVHDIDETPKLFREVADCFFCQYPQGIPDMKPLKEFMIANAEKYGIVPRWSEDKLSIENSFMHKKQFGSYLFKANRWDDGFELSNSRNRFTFYIDLTNNKFIVCEYSSYKARKYLGTSEYNHKTQKSTYEPIANYDKFAKWLWQIVDDFNANK
jgi:hypothetical protein